MPKYNEKDGFVNSYGFNVLRGMVDQINAVVQKQKEIGGPMTNVKQVLWKTQSWISWLKIKNM